MKSQDVEKIISAYQEKWEKKLILMSREMKEMARQLDRQSRSDGNFYDRISGIVEDYEKSGSGAPSKFMAKKYKRLVEAFAGKTYQKAYYAMIDKLVEFPYSTGIDRRTVRAAEYQPWFVAMFRLLASYKVFGMYKVSLADFLTENMPEDFVELKNSYYTRCWVEALDMMIAAGIDSVDGRLGSVIREMILGDNNT
ncbi:MAG: hypothetical protein K2G89_06615, partial [Lachnospiraceae bacterium]|nr:hypothetical protein [Lachnospiraceae bacterium]